MTQKPNRKADEGGHRAASERALHPDTLAVRTSIDRTQYQEHSEPLFMTSSFVFSSAAQAAARFANEDPGYFYSRAGNPTVTAFEKRLAALEGGEACVAAATGMAAITATFMSQCSTGDHIVAAKELFGATVQLTGILKRFGVESTLVPLTDLDAWRAAIQPNTKLLYLESPSNPLTQVGDIAALAELAHANQALLVVDNCFCSPALQQPIALGADIVIHSATKYLDGQGRVMGGAAVGPAALIDDSIRAFLRTSGAVLSPFNAWVTLKGLETLNVRMQQQSRNAMQVAQWLSEQPAVSQVFYPGLANHAQHALAMRQQSGGGAIVSFEMRGDADDAQRAAAWRVIDRSEMLSITTNLGDVKSTIAHPASTSHAKVPIAERKATGLSEGVIRLAVGLEHPGDVIADLSRGMTE